MKRAILLALLAVSVPFAAAQEPASPSQAENLDALVDYWNARAEAVPGPIQALIGDERINLNLTAGNNSLVLGVVMDGVTVDRIAEEPLDDPTLDITMDVETLAAIVSADNPGRRAVEALNDGEIRYEAHGIGNKVVFGGLSLALNLWSALTG